MFHVLCRWCGTHHGPPSTRLLPSTSAHHPGNSLRNKKLVPWDLYALMTDSLTLDIGSHHWPLIDRIDWVFDIYSHLVYCTRVPWESLESMVISLALVNGSHHWPVIKWFLPCSTSDHCNHIDRIILCGRQNEEPGYLFKVLIAFPQVVMEFCISSMDPHLYGCGYAQICICMT